MENPPAQPTKCSSCGGTDFESGWVHHLGYYTFLRFERQDKYHFLQPPGIRVKSKRCLTCNQVTFLCDPAHSSLRFSLRTLLIVTTLVALALGLIVYLANHS